MNANWQRWIVSSIHKHFKDACVVGEIPYFVESVPAKMDQDKLDFWCEGRVDGPFWRGGTKNEYFCTVEVNMLLTIKKNLKDIYKADRLKGLLTVAFTTGLPILKLGDGTDDNPTSVVTCLNLITEGREALIVSDFGQFGPGVQIKQSSVEGHFHGNFAD